MNNESRRTGSDEDELLAIRCQLGERDAFEELVARYAGPLRGYSRRVAGDAAEADDLVQDVWLRILRALPGLRDPARLRSWIFGIAHRALIDRLRERYADGLETDVSIDAFGADDPVPDRVEAEQIIAMGMERLPVIEREVVTLFHLEQFRIEEIAAALQVPLGTVKSRLHRARTRLREAIDPSRKAHSEGECR